MSKKRQPGTFLHVHGHTRYFYYRITVLPGKVCHSQETWETPEDAAVYCQAFKNYLLREYKLCTECTLESEHYSAAAYSRNVPLSNQDALYRTLPESVQTFIREHGRALEAHRDAQPKGEMWQNVWTDSFFKDRPDFRAWGNKCYRADAHAKAFANVNQGYFESLLGGAIKSLQAAQAALGQAETMVRGKDDEKLDARGAALARARADLPAKVAEIAALLAAFKTETNDVGTKLARLQDERPPMHLPLDRPATL